MTATDKSVLKVDTIHKSQRHPIDCLTTPLKIRPSAGPRRGRNVARAKDLPLSSDFQQSLSTGRAIWGTVSIMLYNVSKAAMLTANCEIAPRPAKNLAAIINPRLLAKPQTRFQTVYQIPLATYTGFRPTISVQGSRTRGPKAKARMKMYSARFASSGLVPRAALILLRAGAIIAPDMRVTSPPRDVKIAALHFRQLVQFLRVSGVFGTVPSYLSTCQLSSACF